jgi:hypothetical protein
MLSPCHASRHGRPRNVSGRSRQSPKEWTSGAAESADAAAQGLAHGGVPATAAYRDSNSRRKDATSGAWTDKPNYFDVTCLRRARRERRPLPHEGPGRRHRRTPGPARVADPGRLQAPSHPDQSPTPCSSSAHHNMHPTTSSQPGAQHRGQLRRHSVLIPRVGVPLIARRSSGASQRWPELVVPRVVQPSTPVMLRRAAPSVSMRQWRVSPRPVLSRRLPREAAAVRIARRRAFVRPDLRGMWGCCSV